MVSESIIEALKVHLPSIRESVPNLKKETENSLCAPCIFLECDSQDDGLVYWPKEERFLCRRCKARGDEISSGDVIDFHRKLNGGITVTELAKQYGLIEGKTQDPPTQQSEHTPPPPEKPVKPIAEVWEGLSRQERKEGAVYSLLQQRRGLKYSTVEQHLKGGNIKYAYMGSRNSVAVLFRKIDGTPYTIEYITTDKSNFEFYGQNSNTDKMFRRGYQPKNDGFFFDGKPFHTAERVILVESVINAMSVAEAVPEACVMALGSSDHTAKVQLLRPWQKKKKIICFMDCDEGGHKAVETISKSLDSPVYTVKWPEDTPKGHDVNDLLKTGKRDEINRMIAEVKPVEVQAIEQIEQRTEPKNPFKYASLGKIMTMPVELSPIIEGMFNEGENTLIHAEGGAGKSMFSLHMALFMGSVDAIGSDAKFLDRFLVPKVRNTLIIQSENSAYELKRRVSKMVAGDPMLEAGVSRVFAPQINDDFVVNGAFNDKAFRDQIRDIINAIEEGEGLKLDVLIIDPLISFHNGDENDNQGMRASLDNISQLCRELKMTPVIIHHNKKSPDGGRSSFRGASAIHDWSRSRIELTKDRPNDCIKMAHLKNSNGREFDDMLLRFNDDLLFHEVEQTIQPVSGWTKNQGDRQGRVCRAILDLGGRAKNQAEIYKQLANNTGLAEGTARDHVRDAIRQGYIVSIRDGDFKYELKDGVIVGGQKYESTEQKMGVEFPMLDVEKC